MHQLVFSSLSERQRNRSTSTGRRSYSAQIRPIAPASHSRDIEARYSLSCKGDNWKITDIEHEENEKHHTDQVRITRSVSQHPKTLQIVELGSGPNRYSVVRSVEPQKFIREGNSRLLYVF